MIPFYDSHFPKEMDMDFVSLYFDRGAFLSHLSLRCPDVPDRADKLSIINTYAADILRQIKEIRKPLLYE